MRGYSDRATVHGTCRAVRCRWQAVGGEGATHRHFDPANVSHAIRGVLADCSEVIALLGRLSGLRRMGVHYGGWVASQNATVIITGDGLGDNQDYNREKQ